MTEFAKELGESKIVKVRRTHGPDESDLKEIALLNRIERYGCSANGMPILEREAGPRQAELTPKLLQLRRAERCKELRSPGVKRTMDKLNRATDLDSQMAAACRSICVGISYLAQDRPVLVHAAKEMTR